MDICLVVCSEKPSTLRFSLSFWCRDKDKQAPTHCAQDEDNKKESRMGKMLSIDIHDSGGDLRISKLSKAVVLQSPQVVPLLTLISIVFCLNLNFFHHPPCRKCVLFECVNAVWFRLYEKLFYIFIKATPERFSSFIYFFRLVMCEGNKKCFIFANDVFSRQILLVA